MYTEAKEFEALMLEVIEEERAAKQEIDLAIAKLYKAIHADHTATYFNREAVSSELQGLANFVKHWPYPPSS